MVSYDTVQYSRVAPKLLKSVFVRGSVRVLEGGWLGHGPFFVGSFVTHRMLYPDHIGHSAREGVTFYMAGSRALGGTLLPWLQSLLANS